MVATEDFGLLTTEDVRELLQVGERTLYRMVSAGAIPRPMKIGVLNRWPREQIRRWIDEGCPAEKN